MSPFGRAHTTSYSTLIETMRLSCSVFEFRGDLWLKKTRVPGWCCLCDPTFIRFSRTSTCDGQTDGQTGQSGKLSCMICDHLILIVYDTILEFTPGDICCSVMMLSI